ncbi:hypothetical protein jhhlp_003413 [Lomentospora prolificans]|uniref:DUF676 domain-containing protein n=1 Tax=Lomentospora prolificans TaxID=41688 RepID=A0A2N3N8R8_9PEZI|nr:hypothetical protein jhhlp_003413 [Lomentospora prolificans]
MLLIHQVGSVKIGEVVRYTVTYIPSQDRILPSPEKLHLRIRNTSALVLRGAFVHGPYTLSVSAYPSNFNPNEKFKEARRYGVPEFEPMVKAASAWDCELVVPEHIRQSAGIGSNSHFGKGPEHDSESVSWVIEVASQVIFSSSAAVGFEVLLARDRKSFDISSSSSAPRAAQPGRISDHQSLPDEKCTCSNHHHLLHHHHHRGQPKGVFSRAIRLKVEDTGVLWNTPRLPQWPVCQHRHVATEANLIAPEPPKAEQKKVHLVVLTHGLHSNLGSDMLFLKESIDAAVKKAKADAKARRDRERAERKRERAPDGSCTPSTEPSQGSDTDRRSGSDFINGKPGAYEDERETEEEPVNDDEEVIVRGFSGNATRTERGIKYLGKRLARYILSMTYPDQPYLPPSSKAAWQSLWSDTTGEPKDQVKQKMEELKAEGHKRPFKITSISFIGHSLGGLIQTYAVAYCQKHSPEIFDLIRPVNFIALATPFLGLGNENPLYVRFALDSGLVGRTGQDLGLAWRAPILARNGFDAIMSNLGEMAHKKLKGESHPESKPLLRILPTGPAHTALKKFRNRTVYSNVVNDGIVPLRTSCLLFLDWQGLGRVDKARRDAGLVGTAIGFGWAELTGSSLSPARRPQLPLEDEDEIQEQSGSATPVRADSHIVPQPSQDAVLEDDRQSLMAASIYRESGETPRDDTSSTGQFTNFFSNLFRTNESSKSPTPPTPKSYSPAPTPSGKQSLIYRRSQTINSEDSSGAQSSSTKSRVTSGSEMDDMENSVTAPPRTTIFESAHDLINPQVPDLQYLLDPAKRPRTIFHDRVYHPEDIPAPPVKKRGASGLTMRRRTSGSKLTTDKGSMSGATTPSSPHPAQTPSQETPKEFPLRPKDKTDTEESNITSEPSDKDRDKGKETKQDTVVDGSSMRVEEKIARAYHRDLSWRKVLVKLEPDAHNNIIVRRMFANAFGWPVVHHLVEAHFSDTVTARRLDAQEDNYERALKVGIPPDRCGGETRDAVPAEGGSENVERVKTEDGGEEGVIQSLQRTDSEAREAADTVSDLPATPTTATQSSSGGAPPSTWESAEEGHGQSASGGGGGSRPGTAGDARRSVVRVDSMTWSDRDWADSENDSDSEMMTPTAGSHKGGGPSGSRPGSPGLPASAWNWTEKIVGKKAPPRSRTPTLKSEPTLAESSESQAESERIRP